MTKMEPIPFLDLVASHRDLESELLQVVQQALRSTAFIGGPRVEEFERAFAEFCDARYCVGVGSGTDALRFALIAAGIGQGDVVVTVPNTFIATTEAISQAGALPEFVDVDERTYNMDPCKLREYLETQCTLDAGTGKLISRRSGKRVAAVMPVHLYGQMADMDPILALAEKYGLIVFEDACQAHGAEYYSQKQGRWCRAGSMGRAAAFSFYPGKNLGACGEAGAVTTNDEELARTIRMLRDHGQAKKYHHAIEGYNGRLDAIQAGILQVKLQKLSEWNSQRCTAAGRYNSLLGECKNLTLPYEPSSSKAVYHLFVIRAQNRDQLMKLLAAEGIGTAIHYPTPLHLQEAYSKLEYGNGDFPVAERVSGEIVSLPMWPQIRADQQARVAEALLRLVEQGVVSSPAEQSAAAF
jgi:dTDP-4-amino-4,6-dideoxygalactose transaminase